MKTKIELPVHFNSCDRNQQVKCGNSVIQVDKLVRIYRKAQSVREIEKNKLEKVKNEQNYMAANQMAG
jgi:hypothetical protein